DALRRFLKRDVEVADVRYDIRANRNRAEVAQAGVNQRADSRAIARVLAGRQLRLVDLCRSRGKAGRGRRVGLIQSRHFAVERDLGQVRFRQVGRANGRAQLGRSFRIELCEVGDFQNGRYTTGREGHVTRVVVEAVKVEI